MSAGIVINRAMNAREWLLLLALSFLWGLTFFFVAIAVREIPPITLVFLRVAGAAIVMLIVLRTIGLRLPSERGVWLTFAGFALFNNIFPFALINWGQTHIASGVASILNGTTPFFTVLAAHYFTQDEKITPARLVGVLVGLAGVATMIGGAAVTSLGVNVLGQLAVVGAAISYTIAGLHGRRVAPRGFSPLVTTTCMLIMSSIIMLPVALIVEQPWTLPWPSTNALLAVAGLALPSTALAYIIFFRLLATTGATNITLVTFLIPVTAILLGVGILGETLEPRHFAGMALIGLGLAAIDGRLWRWLRGSRAPAAAE